ncbi:VOC family protein [Flavimobilis marinus]|uniref:Glyoxalase superfamily enzyme, possibly 3-demethylubiquinone-9 3-methyltransferase n=1 Tax=Flavimobilis marinus TaxID=285351 RepID=A0A1I2CHZ0_9MICO|nr:VOC family protein [Flavimobilis marinus]GHG47583.1 VOC family protein [Flavimobilis marinus]SFE67941.1 Glyoxalase superfamily enzyme, possibly 3-demethylubiquinone-9 3-methyltransferase [Flavimobilis marinus]
MPDIAVCLWFDGQAEEAAELYTSIFPNSRILSTIPYPEGAPGPAGSAMLVTFEIDGLKVEALNGGPEFTFSEAVSLEVTVDTQEEIDRYWDALLADGGQPSQCGWLKDKFGMSWQITPRGLEQMAQDPERYQRAMAALMGMVKIDIAALEAAADGAPQPA